MPPISSLVVRDLIRSARDEHSTFDDRRHPDRLLVRRLSTYQRRLVSKIITLNPTILIQVLEQDFPLPDFAAGVTLPDHKYPAGVEAEMVPSESGGGASGGGLREPKFQVELIPWQARFRWHLGAFIRGNVLFLTGTERDWVGFIKLRFYYMPEVEELTGPSSVLVVPNAAEPCLVAYLASVMAQRGTTDKEMERPDPKWFRATWQEVENEFLDEMGRHVQAQTSIIAESF